MLHISRAIDRLNLAVGRIVSWVVIVVVVISAGNALSRKFFSLSSNAWLEVQLYLFGVLFLLPAGYTLLKNSHVRVDILASRLPKRVQIWIEIFGLLFLMFPAVTLILIYAWPLFWSSLDSAERSSNAGGLLLWPGKLIVLVGFALLFLAGISHLIKCIGFLRGISPDPTQKTEATEEAQLIESLRADLENENNDSRGAK
ncbi:TRAP transporter small permease subunit [Paracoccus luteus]|uniref:TRAP transporter small permease subunit n=1 Tax=Paracoccus luteus TaxID=2508543 RepID=UPI00106F6EE0|nr:TRAP transporter small permease subunit [Paracoccus luteus]